MQLELHVHVRPSLAIALLPCAPWREASWSFAELLSAITIKNVSAELGNKSELVAATRRAHTA